MRKAFPNGNDLLRWAMPTSWAPFATTDYARLVQSPSPRLSELKAIYGMPGLASDIVYQNISKVANMSSARFVPGDGNIRTAANLFLGRYGKSCTVYMMMAYFANYLTDYKKVLNSFDIGDLLSGYRQFEERWNAAIGRVMDAQAASQVQDHGTETTGTRALRRFIGYAARQYGVDGYINEGTRPYDPDSEDPQARQPPECGGLLRFGFITPEEVRRIASEAGTEPQDGSLTQGDTEPF